MSQQENLYQSFNMLTGMAIPQPDSSPTVHQSMSWPEIDILCADHAMLKEALYLTVTVMQW